MRLVCLDFFLLFFCTISLSLSLSQIFYLNNYVYLFLPPCLSLFFCLPVYRYSLFLPAVCRSLCLCLFFSLFHFCLLIFLPVSLLIHVYPYFSDSLSKLLLSIHYLSVPLSVSLFSLSPPYFCLLRFLPVFLLIHVYTYSSVSLST